MARYFAGLDVSTQSCKFVIIDWDNHTLEYVGRVNYDEDLPQYKTENGVVTGNELGVSESNPLMWIDAVEKVFKKTADSGFPMKYIKSISVSGQQHGLVALDSSGNLTRTMAKLWNDFSTQEECDLLTEKMGGNDNMISETSNTQRTGYTAAKIYHMYRHERDIYNNTHILFLVHNYINWYLTGGVAVMEPGDTSGTALWNPATQNWSNDVISVIDPDLAGKLPKVESSTKSIGTISKSLAERFGFSIECKIDAGSGDNMYGAVGTGNVKPGIVTVSLGTSGTAYTFLEKPYVDPEGEIASFCDSTGNYLPLLCVSNLANGFDEFCRINNLSPRQFDELINETEPGNDGRILIPWYEGERTPDIPNATPIYFGFALHDFDQKTLARAIIEGHLLNLYNGFKSLPVIPKQIHLTGGLSQSPAWCQTIADIFAAKTTPIIGEGAALGAAIHASWVWLNEAGENIEIDEVCNEFISFNKNLMKTPRPEYQSTYDKQKRLYQALSSRVQGQKGDNPFQLYSALKN